MQCFRVASASGCCCRTTPMKWCAIGSLYSPTTYITAFASRCTPSYWWDFIIIFFWASPSHLHCMLGPWWEWELRVLNVLPHWLPKSSFDKLNCYAALSIDVGRSTQTESDKEANWEIYASEVDQTGEGSLNRLVEFDKVKSHVIQQSSCDCAIQLKSALRACNSPFWTVAYRTDFITFRGNWMKIDIKFSGCNVELTASPNLICIVFRVALFVLPHGSRSRHRGFVSID